jgi:GTP cyclohydrolase II
MDNLSLSAESKISLKRNGYSLDGIIKIYSINNLTTSQKTKLINHVEHVVFVKGEVKNKNNVLTRVHSECITGDLFGSKHCDCGYQLDLTYELMSKREEGIIIYLKNHEGRGIGLTNKIKAYKIQEEQKLNTIDANLYLNLESDYRNYDDASSILKDLNVKTIELLTNNPDKIEKLKDYTSKITSLNTIPTKENILYLTTKKEICNHNINIS